MIYVASKVDMRRYVEGGEDSLECEIQRYNTKGIVMRWPGLGAQEHDVWFTCTLRHSQGLFHLTTFLRHTPAQEGFQERIEIGDRELLTTSGNLEHTINLKDGFLAELSHDIICCILKAWSSSLFQQLPWLS